MKIKYSIISLALCVILISCTDLIVSVRPDDDWKGIENGSIELYYRPIDYSETKSPTWEQADHIINAQNIYYHAIQDSINRSFEDDVRIYLYNYDEAKEKIGTNGGGHALPKFNTYYYTFIDSNRSITDHFGVVDPYIGAHELVHVITHRTLGYPKTKLMSEGYAVWLDGTFARYHIKDIIRNFRDEHPERILSPNDMILNADAYLSSVFYPNAGIFAKFLVKRYGIDMINTIFTVSEDNLISELENLRGESWNELCTAYEFYIENL